MSDSCAIICNNNGRSVNLKPLLPPFAESLLPYKAIMARRKEAAGELSLGPVLYSCAAADMVSFLSPFVCRRATIIQQGMTKITKVEEDSISKPGILRTGDTGESSHSYRPVPRTDPGLLWSGLAWSAMDQPVRPKSNKWRALSAAAVSVLW